MKAQGTNWSLFGSRFTLVLSTLVLVLPGIGFADNKDHNASVLSLRKHSDWRVRARAAESLRAVGQQRDAVDALLAAVEQDKVVLVRVKAAEVLAEINPGMAVGPLKRAFLVGESPVLKKKAATLLPAVLERQKVEKPEGGLLLALVELSECDNHEIAAAANEALGGAAVTA